MPRTHQPDDEFADVAGLDRELIPVRPPAAGPCPPAPITPDQAAHNRELLAAAIGAGRRRERR